MNRNAVVSAVAKLERFGLMSKLVIRKLINSLQNSQETAGTDEQERIFPLSCQQNKHHVTSPAKIPAPALAVQSVESLLGWNAESVCIASALVIIYCYVNTHIFLRWV